MSKNLRGLQARKHTLVTEARSITDLASEENRDLTEDEQKSFDALSQKIASVNAAIDRETMLIAEEAQLGVHSAVGITVHDRCEDDPRRGFASFGEYAQAVRAASMSGNRPDDRLLIGAAAPSTYGGEGVGQDGGFSVPPQYASEIFRLSMAEDSFVPFTDNVTISGNSMVFPKDETVPWGTDGVRAYWQAEATTATAMKPKIGLATLRMHKLMALVPLTDELLADSGALESYLPGKIADSIRWKTNEAILNGNGAGQPQGALSSGASLQVSKDGGQATLTLSAANLANMVARLPPGSFSKAVWLINNDVLGALFTLSLGNYPVYLPMEGAVGAIQNNPYGMILGRPVIVTQHANTFSAVGDVQLHDFSYYRTITKAGGIETASSMHLYFDADATAFRSTYRIDGQPKIAAQISPAKGTNKLSPFVYLQAR